VPDADGLLGSIITLIITHWYGVVSSAYQYGPHRSFKDYKKDYPGTSSIHSAVKKERIILTVELFMDFYSSALIRADSTSEVRIGLASSQCFKPSTNTCYGTIQYRMR
jgi:hypothetical protein